MGCSNIEESFREIIESDIPTSLKRLGKELDAQWIEKPGPTGPMAWRGPSWGQQFAR